MKICFTSSIAYYLSFSRFLSPFFNASGADGPCPVCGFVPTHPEELCSRLTPLRLDTKVWMIICCYQHYEIEEPETLH